MALVATAIMAAAIPAQVLAQGPVPAFDPVTAGDAPVLSIADADTLKPGEYLWHPELGSDGAVALVVDLDKQVAFVYRGDALIGITTISTGKDGKETPLGTYPILQKEVKHRSNLYGAAPMPYMQRLTWDGVALHAGSVPGYRSSHGCVHLPDAFAKALYDETDVGATVAITEDGTTMADALPITPQVTPADPDAPTLDDTEQAPAVVASSAP
ncbi:L,D-transpeptidase family protein [Sphingomonas sp. CGMCC 1.13654]|uniref:L,D-transpeptidase family protein n=2 Tax=Sphingomonas chungangi TaxID=2683589 RepID=A0A838LEM3_9SPHN|nr:L,D-transpeptidase family protein [Sphingomonas chungangi]MVW55961.1 L,D-transpeptidase family protein [Sphingomonas chungangi]